MAEQDEEVVGATSAAPSDHKRKHEDLEPDAPEPVQLAAGWNGNSDSVSLKKLMGELRSEFNGSEFDPHVTAVGAISLTESDARDKFAKSCEGLKTYTASNSADRGSPSSSPSSLSSSPSVQHRSDGR